MRTDDLLAQCRFPMLSLMHLAIRTTMAIRRVRPRRGTQIPKSLHALRINPIPSLRLGIRRPRARRSPQIAIPSYTPPSNPIPYASRLLPNPFPSPSRSGALPSSRIIPPSPPKKIVGRKVLIAINAVAALRTEAVPRERVVVRVVVDSVVARCVWVFVRVRRVGGLVFVVVQPAVRAVGCVGGVRGVVDGAGDWEGVTSD